MADIRLSEVLGRVALAAARVGRSPEDVTLVAVSKSVGLSELQIAYQTGHRDFGENRAGMLADRAAVMPGDVRWHFVGRLQGNKARLVRPIAHLLHSLDRPDLAGHWAKGPGRPPPVLVQVNVAGEDQKAGVAPEQAGDLVAAALDLGLDVRGLMTVPPLVDDSEASRPHFRALAGLRERLAVRWPRITELSMGMTDDFEVAVEEGATLLRVGRAIFGPFPENGYRG
jgi:pyridoxal phosphate enzyme (YggS family)